jgi:magnesium transporter
MNTSGASDRPKDLPAVVSSAPDVGSKMFTYFSALLGRRVVSAAGARLGRLSDLEVKLDESFPKISTLFVRSGKKTRLALGWAEVASFTGRTIVLKPGAEEKFHPPDDKGEGMLLKEELLDKQVVDTYGAKIERVNDVHLLIINQDLRIAHVDIGRRGILRRLGLLRPVEALTKWFFEYEFPEVLVSWKYIQPLASDPRKKDLKLNVGARRLHDLHPSDIADILEDLDRDSRRRIFKSLDLETAADTLQEIDPKFQRSLIEAAPEEKASDLLEKMEPDEATDLLAELPAEKRRKLIQTMEKLSRETLQELLQFKEGTAGSIMTTNYVCVREDQTVGDAISAFKQTTHPLESVAYIYVTDAEDHLLGVVTLRHLLLEEKSTPVRTMMNPRLVSVETEDEVEKVAELFGKYKFLLIPVVDKENVIAGVITFMDIMEERCRL